MPHPEDVYTPPLSPGIRLRWHGTPATEATCATLAQNLAEESGWQPYTQFALVQAVWRDPATGETVDLSCYDSVYERVRYPTDYLWGPGARADALAWLRESPPTSDTVSMLDRTFVIREHEGHVWLPMRPGMLATTPSGSREGHWYLVGADTPDQAFAHVRAMLSGEKACKPSKTCPTCFAETIAHGKRTTVLAAAGLAPDDGMNLPPAFGLPGPGSDTQSIRLPLVQ